MHLWLYPLWMWSIIRDETMEVGSSLKRTHGYGEELAILFHPPFSLWLISSQILITAGGRGCIFNSFCQREEIYLSTCNGKWQGEGKYGPKWAIFDETVMSGAACDKEEEQQSAVTLQTVARSTCRWCMTIQATERYLPDLGCGRLAPTSRFIVLSLVHHQAERVYGIVGNRIFFL